MAQKPETKQRIEQIRALHKARLRRPEIARELGLSRNQLAGLIDRYLPEMKTGQRHARRRKPKAVPRAVKPPKLRSGQTGGWAGAPSNPVPPTPVKPLSGPLEPLGGRDGCQWIEGNPTDPMSGRKRVPDKPYCYSHCRRAYRGYGDTE